MGFSELGIHEMGSSEDSVFRDGELQVSNPCSLLRSKSTRHERRCKAASEWLVSTM